MVKIDQLAGRARTPTTTTPPLPVRATPDPPRHEAKVKLPKLTIHPFKGDLTTWTTFWDSFEAAIHNSPGLSDIDKINYLRSLLQGSALDAISGLTLTAANYEEAVAVLKKRFGNKQQIVAKHMDTLLNIESISSSYNLRALRQLYDTIESQVRGLKSLGVSSDSYGSLLYSVLLSKLPQDLRLVISREVSDDDWELGGLMTLLEKEIRPEKGQPLKPPRHKRRPQISPEQLPPCLARIQIQVQPAPTVIISFFPFLQGSGIDRREETYLA